MLIFFNSAWIRRLCGGFVALQWDVNQEMFVFCLTYDGLLRSRDFFGDIGVNKRGTLRYFEYFE